jgi:hypothetical protein
MVNGNNNVKEWTGFHSSLVVSLHKINNMLGKKNYSRAIGRIMQAYKCHEDHYEIHLGITT